MSKDKKATGAPLRDISPKEATKRLEVIFKSRNGPKDHWIVEPIMLWGPPGIGKSSIVKQISHKYGWSFIDVRLSQLAPLDLRGLPKAESQTFHGPDGETVEDTVTKYFSPSFLPRTKKCVLFLDEINTASMAMMTLIQQLLLDRVMGDYVLPEDTIVIAAGNRKIDGAAVNTIPSPVNNRMWHISVKPDIDDLTAYFMRKQVGQEITAFLNFRPELMHRIDIASEAWPSPRSWDLAAKLYYHGEDVSMAVGEAAAAEFNAFTRVYQSLPSIDEILEGKKHAFPDKEPSEGYAITIGLAGKIKDAKHLANAWRWLNQDRQRTEWAALLAKTMSNTDQDRFMQLFQDLATYDPKIVAELARMVSRAEMLQ